MELATSSGMSPSHISQIERGITSPSLTALRNIAEALDLRLSQLVLLSEPVSLGADRFVSRIADRVTRTYWGTEIAYQLISREGSDLKIQWVTAPPGAILETHQRTSGEECGYVLSGSVRITINGSSATLGPGDAVFIEALSEHGWESIGDENLVMLWTILSGKDVGNSVDEITVGHLIEVDA